VNVVAKLAVFGVGLVAVLGLGVAVGAAFGPTPSTKSGPASMAMVHTMVDGYDVELAREAGPDGRVDLSVTVRLDGASVTDLSDSSSGGSASADSVASAGRLVAVRVADLAYVPVHPLGVVDGASHFEATLAPTGTYRLFFDFARDGVVRTAEFTLDAGVAHDSSGMSH
jgi:hypothetical protein